MVHAPYDRLKSRFRPGHNRFDRARADCEPNPFESSRRHSRLLPRRWPHPALHVAVVQSPSMRSEEIRWHPDHSQLSKTEQGYRDPTDRDAPRR